jgi:hypothetical protein
MLKNDLFEGHFWKLSQICIEVCKKCGTLFNPWNELAAPRALKIIENGP